LESDHLCKTRRIRLRILEKCGIINQWDDHSMVTMSAAGVVDHIDLDHVMEQMLVLIADSQGIILKIVLRKECSSHNHNRIQVDHYHQEITSDHQHKEEFMRLLRTRLKGLKQLLQLSFPYPIRMLMLCSKREQLIPLYMLNLCD